MSYSNQIKQFLLQAKTDELKTKHFEKNYSELLVKVSFGQGSTANIPWISFLKEPNTTSKGIYPVYLYFKNIDLLILAFGVSETNAPIYNWINVEKYPTINSYFDTNFNKKPERYGNSHVYKTYDVHDLPSDEILESDLQNIITLYKLQFSEMKIAQPKENDKEFVASILEKDIKFSRLQYSKKLILRFTASL
ncbi:MAG: DUF3578 domain-containing protein [Saprospiraceae bacterium]|nr:DUF3578 domain-containing protein [Saprospiraceae bacterium]